MRARLQSRVGRAAAALALALAGCAAAPAQPPSPPLPDGAARLVSVTGRVSVLRDANPWALTLGTVVLPQQEVVTGPDGMALFQIADGSTFEVFPNSRVIFRNNRGSWQDLLEVFLGKVRVKIEHLGGQPNHNRVHTPTAVISVRGTVFDVDVEDSEATTLVLVEEGVVEVRHTLQPGAKLLQAGEWIRVFRNQPLAVKYVDRGALLQRAVAATRDAMYQILTRTPGSASRPGTPGTPGTGGNPGSPGDGCKGGSCPAPPPPPPPPPPPGD